LKKQWVIPKGQDGEFVARMEDILELYGLPYDPEIPVVCFDEKPYSLLSERYAPLPMKPGKEAREDYLYDRKGSCSIFVFTQPLAGWRRAQAHKRRTREDFALQIEKLLLEDFPNAEKVRLVMDNLNTHTIGSLYRTFPAHHARRLAKRLEIHYTPKHGSWLNIAEIEISVMARQCLNRRIPSISLLNKLLDSWAVDKYQESKPVVWHFSTCEARDKLMHLYPLL